MLILLRKCEIGDMSTVRASVTSTAAVFVPLNILVLFRPIVGDKKVSGRLNPEWAFAATLRALHAGQAIRVNHEFLPFLAWATVYVHDGVAKSLCGVQAVGKIQDRPDGAVLVAFVNRFHGLQDLLLSLLKIEVDDLQVGADGIQTFGLFHKSFLI
jgi:hypothetical protein